MSLKEIYKDFQSLPNPMAKVEYLKSLQTMNLNHKIKYEKLIEIWSARKK